MELGADGVLMNTAIAGAQDPVAMAEAMKHAVLAGRLALSRRAASAEDVRDRQQPGRRTGRPLIAERAQASRAFGDAIALFEAALAKIEAALSAPPSGEEAAHLAALGELAHDASPLLKKQQAFNTAVVNELKHQRAFQRAVVELIRCQTSLVAFLRTIKPYVRHARFRRCAARHLG